MRAGELDRRVVIQQRTLTQGSSGEEVESWADIGAVWMGKRDTRDRGGNERWAADQLVAEIHTLWTAHWSPVFETIHPDTHRLVYRNRVYEIHGAPREIGRHEGVEIATAARGEARYG